MNCKQLKKLLIDNAEDIKSGKDAEVEAHVSTCTECEQFYSSLMSIRDSVNNAKYPVLPNKLANKTLNQCHKKLLLKKNKNFTSQLWVNYHMVPQIVWIAIAIVIVLTISWVFPRIAEAVKNQNFTYYTGWIVILLIQNIVMLIFTPLLLHQFKVKWVDKIIPLKQLS